ncbi:MAG TPA: PDZ domain-containing protein, partial [Burkholderiales bacterium]|nr:PDZ domain-containing protein [Burkholderiales bacterium]
RGFIGIAGADIRLPRRALSRLDLTEERAVHVLKVEPGKAAAKAGLREGDVLLELGGRDATGIAALARLLGSETIGVPREARVLRGSQILTLTIVPGESGN